MTEPEDIETAKRGLAYAQSEVSDLIIEEGPPLTPETFHWCIGMIPRIVKRAFDLGMETKADIDQAKLFDADIDQTSLFETNLATGNRNLVTPPSDL